MYGEKLDSWITQAREAGLDVTVEADMGSVLQSVNVTVKRQQVEENNLLDVTRNRESLRLHAVRTFNRGKWSNYATFYGMSCSRDLTLARVPYYIRSLATD